MVKIEHNGAATTIHLKPNRSLEWSELLPWLLILCVPCAGIAIAWFTFGVWAILPFAGIEIALVSFVFCRICYFNHRKQKLVIEQHDIEISTGIHSPLQRQIFKREQSHHVFRVTPENMMTLFLICREKEIELGSFLTDTEKGLLSKALISARIPKRDEKSAVLCG